MALICTSDNSVLPETADQVKGPSTARTERGQIN